VSETVRKTVRKTFKYKLQPTPAQEWELERTLVLCRWLYNVALEQRITAWQRCHASVSRYQQEAELKAIRAEMPDYASIHSHVLQDVLARLDKTYQAFFRRVKAGQTPGFPRFKGRDRYHSFTFKEYDNGATLDHGFLVLAKIGRIAVRWSRPLEGTPKTVTISQEADGWYACFSWAGVPVRPLPTTGQATGIDLGLESFATLADGSQIANPRIFRVAELALRRAQRRVARRKKGSHRRRKAVHLLAKAHQTVQRTRRDFHHKTALALVRQHDTIYHEDPAAGQHGQDSPSRQEHRGCRVGPVPLHPVLQSGRSWEDSGSRAGGVHLASRFGLRSHRPEGALRPVASLPGLWDESAAGPQRRTQHLARRPRK
jgi:putative transposase